MVLDVAQINEHTVLMTTTNTTEKRIAKYARAMAKTVLALRAENTDWARAEAAQLEAAATQRCQEMREAGWR